MWWHTTCFFLNLTCRASGGGGNDTGVLAENDPRPPIVETPVSEFTCPPDAVWACVCPIPMHLIVRPPALVGRTITPDIAPHTVIHVILHVPLILCTACQRDHAVAAVHLIVFPISVVTLRSVCVLALAMSTANPLDFHPIPFVKRTVRKLGIPLVQSNMVGRMRQRKNFKGVAGYFGDGGGAWEEGKFSEHAVKEAGKATETQWLAA